MISLRELRRSASARLSEACVENAAYDADLLIEKAYGLGRSELITKADMLFDEGAVLPLIERRAAGEPTQYILGEWEFYGLPFYVGEGVLIPRQDTEILVDRALELIKGRQKPRVLELCSGSGCIAVAIAKMRPDASITAVELYDPAMGYLQRNIERNGVQVTVRRFDVMREPTDFSKYDLLVANPPYITAEAMKALQREVGREPSTALYGGEDGLGFYRAIADSWLRLVENGGAFAVEIGFDQGRTVRELFLQKGVNAVCEQDLNGLDRVVYGTLNRL